MQVNPHVTSILQTRSETDEHCVARNACGSIDAGACNTALAGISAFAFQGTNAHAILGTSLGKFAIGDSNTCIWKRKRAWCVAILLPEACHAILEFNVITKVSS